MLLKAKHFETPQLPKLTANLLNRLNRIWWRTSSYSFYIYTWHEMRILILHRIHSYTISFTIVPSNRTSTKCPGEWRLNVKLQRCIWLIWKTARVKLRYKTCKKETKPQTSNFLHYYYTHSNKKGKRYGVNNTATKDYKRICLLYSLPA